MNEIKKIDEIIKSLDEFRHMIERLTLKDVESENITSNEGEGIFLAKDSNLQPLASTKKIVFTLKELAEMFHVTMRTIYNWKEQGRLNYVQIRSKTYLTEKQLYEFLAKNQVKSY